MARPLRVEYAGAWYHVMNRGAGRKIVFPSDRLRYSFLTLLNDIHERYGVEIHGWCLMGNHYHLLVRTPEPNLGRAMRHVDGVYTQRHNRAVDVDGALFRGRYTAILVQKDQYLLQLSRYIHRNPVDAEIVEQPEQWRWSSYRSYLGLVETPDWLYTRDVLNLFPNARARRRYRAFVDQGLDDQIRAYYDKTPVPPVLGSEDFREFVERLVADRDVKEIPDARRLRRRPDIQTIIDATAAAFDTRRDVLLEKRRGRANLPRALAMSLCRAPGGHSLEMIANAFGLQSGSGVAMAIQRLATRISEPEIAEIASRLKRQLFGGCIK